MILDYGFSIIGKSHIAKGSCCQDSHYIKKLDNGWVVAASADGVGSAKNSAIGSKIAAETVVEFCCECMPHDYNTISIKSMMRTAYNYAFKRVLKESERSGEPIESYDTTLDLVIYDGHHIIYGHSGDGGIIGLNTFGNYIPITSPQKGSDGVSVIPLRFGYTTWIIDEYEEDLAAVMLMTDGMLETFCPYLLRDYDAGKNMPYIPLISFFADPKGFSENSFEEDKKAIERFLTASDDYNPDEFYARLKPIYDKHLKKCSEEIIGKIAKKNYPVNMMKNEQDDKTVVAIINTDMLLDDRDENFYAEPDWESFKEAWNRIAYPHLYEEKAKKPSKISQDKPETPAPEIPESRSVPNSEDLTKDFEEMMEKKKEQRAAPKPTEMFTCEIEHTPPPTQPKSDTGNGSSDTDSGNMAPPKHPKPKKQGILQKIEDLFN